MSFVGFILYISFVPTGSYLFTKKNLLTRFSIDTFHNNNSIVSWYYHLKTQLSI